MPSSLESVHSETLQHLWQAIDAELQELTDHHLRRTLVTIEAIDGPRVKIRDRWLVSWCTNDYLGLSSHPRLVQAASQAAAQWGIGARASRLLVGSTRLHTQLEERLAAFFRADAAVVFPSGYLTNLGVLGVLLSRDDVVLIDRLAHASLVEACRDSHATLRVFHHNDAAHVADLLSRYQSRRRRVIVTEGIFSMDGDRAPLARLLEVAQAHEALLYVDDAHGAFVVGQTGRGSPEAAGISHDALLYMGTLGKALGCQGGFVVGPSSLMSLIHHRARTFLYTTALAVPVVAAAAEALCLVEEDASPRRRLEGNVSRLHDRLCRIGIGQTQTPSHVVSVRVGSSSEVCELSSAMWDRGIFAPAIRPPTVPEGTARLRISMTALHTPQHIDQLIGALQELGRWGSGQS